jgi:hypothetical protein
MISPLGRGNLGIPPLSSPRSMIGPDGARPVSQMTAMQPLTETPFSPRPFSQLGLPSAGGGLFRRPSLF